MVTTIPQEAKFCELEARGRLLRGSRGSVKRAVRHGGGVSWKVPEGSVADLSWERLTEEGLRKWCDGFLIVGDLFILHFKRAFLLICQQATQGNVNNLL